MKRSDLIEALKSVQNASRIHRDSICDIVLSNPKIIPDLIRICFEENNKLSIKSFWALELLAKKSLEYLKNDLDFFCQNIHKLKFDSAKRPAAKICELIALDFAKIERQELLLTSNQQEQIIECCFDWMIGQEKIAVQVYSMQTIFLLGRNYDWVRPELALILKDKIANASCGYRSSAKKILKAIN